MIPYLPQDILPLADRESKIQSRQLKTPDSLMRLSPLNKFNVFATSLNNKESFTMTHDNTNTQTFRKTSTYAMVVTALMAAVTCILAPLSVPIGPVPISLTNFAIYLSLYLLDWKKRNFKLPDLPVARIGRASGILRIHRWTGKNWQVRPADTSSDLFQWQSSQVLSLTKFTKPWKSRFSE